MGKASTENSLERKCILKYIVKEQPQCPALFLDRDGVIIEDKHYLSDPREVKLCDGSLELIRYAFEYGWHVVIITNQSGISRGLFNWEDYEKVTKRVLDLLGKPMPISAIYANGYGPNASETTWRKPSPIMLIQASKDLNIDLSKSILVGDRHTDLKSGASAGVGTVAHVLTGHGKKERDIVTSYSRNSQFFLWKDYSPKLILLNSLKTFPLNILNYASTVYKSNFKNRKEI